mmetsp:Transcript_61659/g.173877  ORF Transcript_61659/g.173877 Transcript_61659/m.173877 type:complete len:235 (-) Transcript_61659:72-776(-)
MQTCTQPSPRACLSLRERTTAFSAVDWERNTPGRLAFSVSSAEAVPRYHEVVNIRDGVLIRMGAEATYDFAGPERWARGPGHAGQAQAGAPLAHRRLAVGRVAGVAVARGSAVVQEYRSKDGELQPEEDAVAALCGRERKQGGRQAVLPHFRHRPLQLQDGVVQVASAELHPREGRGPPQVFHPLLDGAGRRADRAHDRGLQAHGLAGEGRADDDADQGAAQHRRREEDPWSRH